VHIDPPDLEFILDNLVGNAIRAMVAAPRKVLCLGWTLRAGQVVVTVSDSGWGIEPEDWDHIFEPGASGRPDRGLGLARSRHELGIYGGSLRVLASRPGRGTTFELRLPPARVAVHGDRASPVRLVEREEGA
jgi:signal transduction histidine kinase